MEEGRGIFTFRLQRWERLASTAGCRAPLPWPLIDTIPWQNPLDLRDVRVCVCFKALPLLYLWKKGLSMKYEMVINPQTLVAVFSRVVFLISLLVLLMLQIKMFSPSFVRNAPGWGRSGEFYLFWFRTLAHRIDPAFCVLIPSKSGKHPIWSRSFSVSSIIS